MKMIPDNYVITNVNDIYVYFYIIHDINPDTVLDLGAFLKRIGAVSRSYGNYSIQNRIKLYGVDFGPEIDLNIYSAIYNEFKSIDKMNEVWRKNYKLSFAFRIKDIFTDGKEWEIYKNALNCSEYLVIDYNDGDIDRIDGLKQFQFLTVEKDRYCMIKSSIAN